MDGIMSSKLFATRQGTILLGVIAAVIAAIALIVYLHEYRSSVSNVAMTPVLVATGEIQAGTPGKVIGSDALYRIANRPQSEVDKTRALVDPAVLKGEVALTDIYPGQALIAADFGPSTGSITDDLSPNDRAVVIPLGTPQQVGGQIGGGSHVDVWVTLTGSSGRSVVEQLFQDVYVLGASGGNVTLRTSPEQAGQLIWASENAQIWFVLRPTIGSTHTPAPVSGLKAGG